MRPFRLDQAIFQLLYGSLGAPIVYFIFGFATTQRSPIDQFGIFFAAVLGLLVFWVAYVFSGGITAIFLIPTLLVAARLSLSWRITWMIVASWPVVLGIVMGYRQDPESGAMVLVMGFANALLIHVFRDETRSKNPDSASAP